MHLPRRKVNRNSVKPEFPPFLVLCTIKKSIIPANLTVMIVQEWLRLSHKNCTGVHSLYSFQLQFHHCREVPRRTNSVITGRHRNVLLEFWRQEKTDRLPERERERERERWRQRGRRWRLITRSNIRRLVDSELSIFARDNLSTVP